MIKIRILLTIYVENDALVKKSGFVKKNLVEWCLRKSKFVATKGIDILQ